MATGGNLWQMRTSAQAIGKSSEYVPPQHLLQVGTESKTDSCEKDIDRICDSASDQPVNIDARFLVKQGSSIIVVPTYEAGPGDMEHMVQLGYLF